MSRVLDNQIRRSFDTVGIKLDPDSHKSIQHWLQQSIDINEIDTITLKQYCNNIAKQCKIQANNTVDKKINTNIVTNVLHKIDVELTQHTNSTVDVNDENNSNLSNVSINHINNKKNTNVTKHNRLPYISVISAYKQPCYRYDMINKQFHLHSTSHQLSGMASERTNMLIERYNMQWQRLQRNELFAVPVTALSMHNNTSYHEIIDITSLLSRGSYSGKHIIFGMLSSVGGDTDYCIEDCMNRVHVDLSGAAIAGGYYTNSCYVLAEGELRDNDIFYITSLGHPPAEHRSISLNTYPILDLFGCNNAFELRASEIELEKQFQLNELLNNKVHENDMIVILSDVHIDQINTMNKLRILFDGLAAAQPAVFVFMGNFTSHTIHTNNNNYLELKYYFDQLCDLICSYPQLAKQSTFIFIGGPNDPTLAGNILPSPGLPPSLTQRLRDKLSHCIIGSNPCRLMYYGRELTLYRDDLLQKVRRNCIIEPATDHDDHNESTLHLVKTIVDQSHLSPFTLSVKPISWSYDHSLRIYPLPDLLVLADCVDQYEHNENCLAINPGQFSTDYSFVVYMPQANKPEFSRIT